MVQKVLTVALIGAAHGDRGVQHRPRCRSRRELGRQLHRKRDERQHRC